jgi:hypothetical protein
VLLKLQPYAQSSVVNHPFPKINHPFPKLAFKYFGPYEVAEKVGQTAYKLKLSDNSMIHPVFHVSQLKAFALDYSPVFSQLPDIPALDVADLIPEKILDRRLVRKGSVVVVQILVKWTGLPESSATWEDLNVLLKKFPSASV